MGIHPLLRILVAALMFHKGGSRNITLIAENVAGIAFATFGLYV